MRRGASMCLLIAFLAMGRSCSDCATDPGRQLVPGQRPTSVCFGKTGKVMRVNGAPVTGTMPASVELWEWDGTKWKFVNDNGPEARNFFSMTYDSGRGLLILFGGHTNAGSFFNDVWQWDGSAWTK